MSKSGIKRYLLGFDLGSSSVKASLLNIETGTSAGSAQSPSSEMAIQSEQPGWAEQNPELWWEHICKSSNELIKSTETDPNEIHAIGISYQMHGLVVLDKNRNLLRPSIIWCDSRAAEIGQKAFEELGTKFCLSNFLNSPGNFTASKLKWIKENEPETYQKIDKIMLPGDYAAFRMTGNISTTMSGLSEGILWNFQNDQIATELINYYEFSPSLIPEIHPSFQHSGDLSDTAAKELGLKKGIPVTYRAGDQPNNALSLNVLKSGELATTAGTSGVIYAVTDKPLFDPHSRVNSFVHVNHQTDRPSYGVLLCINGTGILNSWVKNQLTQNGVSYNQMNDLAATVPIGSDGLLLYPFGNGSERILKNKNPGSWFTGLNFNRHQLSHLLRASQEGIVFSMNYGFDIMKEMGVKANTVKAGLSNMFLSPVFREAFVNTTETELELYQTDGAEGAARGAGLGAGVFKEEKEAFSGLKKLEKLSPEKEKTELYQESYQKWLDKLNHNILQE